MTRSRKDIVKLQCARENPRNTASRFFTMKKNIYKITILNLSHVQINHNRPPPLSTHGAPFHHGLQPYSQGELRQRCTCHLTNYSRTNRTLVSYLLSRVRGSRFKNSDKSRLAQPASFRIRTHLHARQSRCRASIVRPLFLCPVHQRMDNGAYGSMYLSAMP